MHAAIYARVSTEDQARTGYSLGDQVENCRQRLLSQGYSHIGNYVDDGYSGEFLDRPALSRLRDDLRDKKISIVLIYDPDRLSRNLTNQLILADEIEKSGAKLDFITGSFDASPEGRLFFSMRGAIAEFEKAKIRERTMRGKRAKALTGKMVSKPFQVAYGYEWDAKTGKYKINAREAEIVRQIYDLFLEEGISVRKLTLLLKSKGFQNREEKPFSLTHVHRILINETYTGTLHIFKVREEKIAQYKTKRTKRSPEEWVSLTVPPIITQELFFAARKQLDANQRLNPRNTAREYLLRGFLRCGVCGYAYSPHYRAKLKNDLSWYSCISPNTGKLEKCRNKAIKVSYIDKLMWEIVTMTANRKKGLNKLIESGNQPDHSGKINEMNAILEGLKKKRTMMMKWYREGRVDGIEAEKELDAINRECQSLSKTIANLSLIKPVPINITVEEILTAKSFKEKRQTIEKLGFKIYIDFRGAEPIIDFRR